MIAVIEVLGAVFEGRASTRFGTDLAAQLTRILSWLPQIKNVPISGTCNVRCILIPLKCHFKFSVCQNFVTVNFTLLNITRFDLVQVIGDSLLGEVPAGRIAMFIVQIMIEADDIRHAVFFYISHKLTVGAHNESGACRGVVQGKLSHRKLTTGCGLKEDFTGDDNCNLDLRSLAIPMLVMEKKKVPQRSQVDWLQMPLVSCRCPN
jgi:hypothetical protein